MKQTVVLGITSGIAAFKALEVITLLKKEGIDVRVVMTKKATQMLNPKDVERVSGNKVYVELFEKGFDYKKVLDIRRVEHIDLADSASIMAIVPATASVIGKLAYGIAEDFLTTTALAVTAPILIAPAMNVHMWTNPIVAENITKLKKLGYQIIEPERGLLACGYEGKGRLADVKVIVDEIMKQLARTERLKGKKMIVTAGGTVEKIDEVRSITNRSSGKMGIAIAEELYLQGADVLLLRAKNSVEPRYLIQEEIFETTEDLSDLIKQYVGQYDAIYHVAAVSDFTVIKKDGKISSTQEVSLDLKPQVKILDQIKTLNPQIKLIAFKAEHDLSEKVLIEKALKRLKEAKADMIVANDISKKNAGFEVDTNEVILVYSNGNHQKLPNASKREIAQQIIASSY